MRAARDGADGIYLMAAAVADPSMCDEVRDDLRAITEKKAERLHWRHETPERQAKIAAAIGNHDVIHLVVVGTPLDARLVKALRGKRSISPSIRVEFARPKDEPMLWIPDAVAGAVNGAQSGRASALGDMGQIEIIKIELP